MPGLLLGILMLAVVASGAYGDDVDQTRVRAARLRAQAYLATGALQQAEGELQRLVELQPDDRYLLADLASVLRRLGRGQEAEEIYRRLLARHPGDRSLRDALAYLLFEQADYAEVVEVLSPVMADPEQATTDQLQMLAVACDRSDQSERADALYDELLGRHPEEPRYQIAMGERLLAADRADEARGYLVRAHELTPGDPRVLKGLARAVGPANAQYEELLLEVLRRDLDDPEAPFLLGESLQAQDPERAARFYHEVLRRLEAGPPGDPYLSRLQARCRFRLGEAAGLALYDSLITTRPDDAGLRVEVAELLLADGQSAAALQRLPQRFDAEVVRRTRGRAHAATGAWDRAAEEWANLARQRPTDVDLHLDLVDAWGRADRWRSALALADSLRRHPRPAIAERAYELGAEVRRGRGRSAGLELGHTGLPQERRWRLGPVLRAGLGRSGFVRLEGSHAAYRDDAIAFSGRLQRLAAEVGAAPRPGWEASAGGAVVGGRLRGLSGMGARLRVPTAPAGRGVATLVVAFAEPWDEPVDALQGRALYDQQQATLALPLGRWFVSLDGRHRAYRDDDDRDLGKDDRVSGYLSRELWRRPYGAPRGLRSVSVTFSHERSWASQPASLPGTLRLPRRTALTTMAVFTRFLFAGHGHVDVAPFLGADAERDLGPGELFGAAMGFQCFVRPALALYGDAFVASESRAQAAGGQYRTGRLGLRIDLD